MGTQIGPAIPLNDLTLYLDASLPTSYPGYGSIWYDISGKGNNFTLFNNPTHNGERLNFNGSTQYAQCVNTTCGNFGNSSFTIEYVVKINETTSTKSAISKRGSYVVVGGPNRDGWMDRNNTVFFVQDNNPDGFTNDYAVIVNLSNTPTDGNIYHMVQIVERNGMIASGSQYKNGALNSRDSVDFSTGTPGSGLIENNVNMLLMNVFGSTGPLSGSMYFVRLYNKALSTDEIQDNYDIARNKYGI